MSLKRGRDSHQRVPEESLESRIANLIVKVGDGDSAAQLSHHLEGLADALLRDLRQHHQLIVETILDCARSLHVKSMVYATLTGLLNESSGHVGLEIAEGAQRELQNALEDHAPLAIRGLTRFVAGLMSAHVVAPSYVIELLKTYLSSRDDSTTPTARTEWFAVLVMDALILCGKELAASEPVALTSLLEQLESCAEQRKALRDTVPLLLPFSTSTTAEEFVEHFDALWSIVRTGLLDVRAH